MSLVDRDIIGSQRRASRAQMLAYGRKANAAHVLSKKAQGVVLSPLSAAELAEIVDAFISRGAYYGIAGDAAFAQSIHETAAYTFGGQVGKAQHNVAGLGATNDGAAGGGWPTWPAGIEAYYIHLLAWCNDRRGDTDYRIAPVRQEAKRLGWATSWRSLGGRWAVPGLTYGDAIEKNWQAILQEPEEATMGHVPRPPITNHIIGIPPKRDGVGVNRIGGKRTPGATVLHSMAGTLGSCDNYFPGPNVEALTDFGIGQTDFGGGFAQIIQWCDIHGTLMPWASGPVRVPEGDGPRFLAHFGGAAAVNNVGVSIEHDDTTLANGTRAAIAQAPVTVYQWSASLWLQAWLHAEVFGQTAAAFDWNMYHYEFCGKAYKGCPQPRITAHTGAHQAAVKAIMEHFQAGLPYPSGGLVVAGIRINTPPESGAGKVPIVAEEGDVQVPQVNETRVQVVEGQIIVISNYGPEERDIVSANVNTVDQGVTGTNKRNEDYSKSQQNNKFRDFVRTR